MQQTVNFTINSLQHIGIPVTDVNISAAFYARLGFKNTMQSPFTFKGETGTCIMMQREEMIIEIYQMPDAELTEICNRKDGRVDHFAFDVSDIDEAFDELTAKGFALIETAPVFLPFWENGIRFFNVSGPDGERIEFNQVL